MQRFRSRRVPPAPVVAGSKTAQGSGPIGCSWGWSSRGLAARRGRHDLNYFGECSERRGVREAVLLLGDLADLEIRQPEGSMQLRL